MCSFVHAPAPAKVVAAVSAAMQRSCFAGLTPLLGDTKDLCFATVSNHSASYAFAVRPRNDVVSKFIRNTGAWEAIAHPEKLLSMAARVAGRPSLRMAHPSGTMLDVGSNMGYFTMQFAKAGWSVLAVEPMAHNRRALQLSLCANPDAATRVRLISSALGSPADTSDGFCVLRSSTSTNQGNGQLACGSQAKLCLPDEAGACERVPLTTLDQLLEGLEPRPAAIDVMKMDVEGFECAVLAGSSSLFTRYRPSVVLMEGKYYASKRCALSTAASHNYTVHSLNDRDHNLVWVRDPHT